ncbi:MAG TPA: hypothetical protein VFE37_30215 [Chloroflexota bacterium]|nr:hypothetical protein [Chloroflexota bacterium]
MWQQALFALSVAALATWLAWPGQTCWRAQASRAARASGSDLLGPALLALVAGQILLHVLGRW